MAGPFPGIPSRLAAAGLLLLVSSLFGSCGEPPDRPGSAGPRPSVRSRAAELIRQGEPRKAMDLLQEESDLQNPEDAFLLGEAALRAGRYENAEEAYLKVLEARPDDLTASLRLARVAYLQNRYADSKNRLDGILARFPDQVEARALRSRIRMRMGDLNGAAVDARRWSRLSPKEAEPLRILGTVQRQRGDPAGAVEMLKRAVALEPTDLNSRQELAKAYAEAGRRKLSEETRREALRMERLKREAERVRLEADHHRIRAIQYLEQGDVAEALKDYQDALSHDPENPDMWREAGEAALAAGDPDRALEYLDQAVRQAPSRALIWRTRGKIRLARGETEGALGDLLEAARLDPDDPAVHRLLANTYRILGRPEAERESALAADLEARAVIPPPPEITP
jgi:tetratricopeptide (TPR) repeat protein